MFLHSPDPRFDGLHWPHINKAVLLINVLRDNITADVLALDGNKCL